MATLSTRRRAGVTVPLFSLRSAEDWGIGEIFALNQFAEWASSGGFSLVQVLPLGELSGGEASPYGALGAFGIDPVYISLSRVAGVTPSDLSPEDRASLERARRAPGVDYAEVRRLKAIALRGAFRRTVGAASAPLDEDFRRFCETERVWLEDYCLFRTLKHAHQGVAWWEWEEGFRRRDPATLDEARAKFADEIAFQRYAQWIGHRQWHDVRVALRAMGVLLMGDLPFIVGRDSADVWAQRAEFRDDVAVGVPPDAFDGGGQDWDLPAYDWGYMRGNGYAWMRRRVRYALSMFDACRIDHLVGLYRTYYRSRDARRDAAGALVTGTFTPADEPAQLAQGEAVLGAMMEVAAEQDGSLVAEDLGEVPAFVRQSLARLGLPGYRVLMWERDGATFRDPAAYPEASVACFGTHDTAPVAAWWVTLSEAEREQLATLAGQDALAWKASAGFSPEIHRGLVRLLYGSGSELALLLVQDALGARERINTPGTVGPDNWTYRIPAVATLQADPAIRARMGWLAESARASGRLLR